MRRFHVASLDLPIVLSREATHHMLHVLRFVPNDTFVLFDGLGLQCEATLRSVDDGVVKIELIGHPQRVPAVRQSHLLIGLPKHASMDRALRMASEIGITDVHPFIAKRSAAKGDRMKRWEGITAASTAQCGRSDTVRLHPAASLHEHIQSLPADTLRFIALPGAERRASPTGQNPRAIVIGPEGGLADTEVSTCLQADFKPVGLAQFTLRTDTAVALATRWLTQ